MVDESAKSLANWAIAQKKAIRILADHADAQHVRLISYEKFCQHPTAELARLMALIPVNLQPHQLLFRPPKDVIGVADPKTREKSGGISVSDYSGAVDDLIVRYKSIPEMSFLLEIREIFLKRIGREDDRLVVDALSHLAA